MPTLRSLILKITASFVVICIAISVGAVSAGMYDYLKPKDNEVAIHFSGIEVPLERILLIRKDNYYCAVKFINGWTEIDEKRKDKFASSVAKGTLSANEAEEASKKKYADYESYYQADGSGDFSKKNVKQIKGRASSLPLRGPFRPFIYQPGDSYVDCGQFKLTWNYMASVGVMPPDKGMGDFGFELAPTIWTDISEVNVFDPRIAWYKYDEKRERVFIHIDNLWEEKK